MRVGLNRASSKVGASVSSVRYGTYGVPPYDDNYVACIYTLLLYLSCPFLTRVYTVGPLFTDKIVR